MITFPLYLLCLALELVHVLARFLVAPSSLQCDSEFGRLKAIGFVVRLRDRAPRPRDTRGRYAAARPATASDRSRSPGRPAGAVPER